MNAMLYLLLLLFTAAALPAPQGGSTGLMPVQRSGKWGFIDRSAAMVIAPQFDEAGAFSEGLAAVRRGERWGYIDASGRAAIPFRFTLARRFSDGLAHVRWPSESGADVLAYIDHQGDTAFVCDARDAKVRMTRSRCGREFAGGYVAEAIEVFRCNDEPGNPKEYPCRGTLVDSWGFYDKTGTLAIPGPFHSGLTGFAEGVSAAAAYGVQARGFIDTTGTFVIPMRYQQAGPFSEGLANVRLDNRWGFVDRLGRMVITPQFVSAGRFSEGLAIASINPERATFGYINRAGQFVITPRFGEAQPFSEGLAAVCCDGGRSRYIDRTGGWAFAASFRRAHSFVNGIARVDLDGGGEAYIDRSGRLIATVRD